jgi:hypothetical protein
MLQRKSCARACLVVLLAVPLVASTCRSGASDDERRTKEQLEKLNAESKFNAGQQQRRQVLLAVEVAVRADGVEAVGARVIRAPAPSHSAEADLRVTARAGSQTVADYTIPDPRLAEVDRREGEGGGLRILPEGRIIVFAPLSENLSEIVIAPVEGRDERVSKGGTLDARTLAVRACEGQDTIEECRRVLAAKPPGTTATATPTNSPPPPTPATPTPRPPG